MFVPIEGALAAALEHDPHLANVAAEHHVAITTPTTLLIALKTIVSVWRVDRRNKNAEEIAARAGKLYDKFVGFAGDLSELGRQLKTTHATYDAAMGKLQLGRGNLVGQVEKLKELGAKTSKALPRQLAADSDSELAEPAA